MAMLITKFNSILRSRLLWWIIGGIVIISFVGWFTPRGCEPASSSPNATATLDGEPITDAELRQARFHVYLGVTLLTGRPPAASPELDQALTEEAWRRIAALRQARKLGLTASPAEVLAAIQRDPDFQVNGVFSKSRYQTFVNAILPRIGCTAAQFEQHLAENITLDKLQRAVGSAAWVSPAELQRHVANHADRFRLEYVLITTNTLPAPVQVTMDDARRFFEDHTNLFVVPPKVAVRYVAFPISNFLAQATVDDLAIEDYYLAHQQDYTVTDTNGTETVRPLDEVRAEISNIVLRQSATLAAKDAATDFVVALAPDREGTGPAFEEIATRTGLTVRTTDLFAAGDTVPGIEAGPLLHKVAFELRPTPDEYFSDALVGTQEVYVLALHTNTEERLPAFEEVAERVLPLARQQAEREALEAQAEQLRQQLQNLLAEGKTFQDAAHGQGLVVVTTAYFSVHSAPAELDAPAVLREITGRNAGELTAPVVTTNGLILAHIVERLPATPEEAEAVQSQLLLNLSRRRARVLFSEWQSYLLRAGKFTTRAPRAAPPPEPLDPDLF